MYPFLIQYLVLIPNKCTLQIVPSPKKSERMGGGVGLGGVPKAGPHHMSVQPLYDTIATQWWFENPMCVWGGGGFDFF